jgi:hypothetical protein
LECGAFELAPLVGDDISFYRHRKGTAEQHHGKADR